MAQTKLFRDKSTYSGDFHYPFKGLFLIPILVMMIL